MTRPDAPAAHDEPFDAPPVGGIPYRWVALVLVCVGVYLGTLDASIINIALPVLADEFNVGADEVIWVTLIFIVVSTGLSLVLGRLGDLYGRRTLYMLGFALFTLAAALSAVAWSLPVLLGGRVIQAIGASMTLANGAAILTATFPPSQRGQALGIQVATVGAGVASGPVLGGLLVDVLDWRAIFWTRIPLGLIGSLLVWRFLIDPPAEQRPRGLDLTGSVVLFAMLSALVLAVNRGTTWGWTSGTIIGLFACGVLLVIAFIVVERRVPSPVVDLALFRDRAYSAAVTAAILQFFGLSAVIILMPFYLVEGRGFSTLEAGGIMAAFPLAMLVISPLSGFVSDRLGARGPATVGLVFVVIGLGALATIDADTSVPGLILRLLLVGIGTAIFSSPNTSTIMSSVPPDRLGTASASQTTARTIGNAIGIAVAGALFTAQSVAFAEARSPLGMDDPAVAPAAIVSGVRLAMLVAAFVSLAGVPASLMRGAPPTRELRARATADPPGGAASTAASSTAAPGSASSPSSTASSDGS